MAGEKRKKLRFESWKYPDREEQARIIVEGMLKMGCPMVSKDGIMSRLKYDELGIRMQPMSKDNLLAEIHLKTEYLIQKWEKAVDREGKQIFDQNGKPVQKLGVIIGDVHRHLLNVIYGMPWPENRLWMTRGVMTHPIINKSGNYVMRNGLSWREDAVNGVMISMPVINLADGYDPHSKYFFAVHNRVIDALKGIEKQKPTDKEVIEALECLDEFLCDFKFTTKSAKASAIAFMLTMICREIIEGNIPMLEVRAAESQTGKTLLTKMMIIAVTGEPPSLFSPDFKDSSEFGKELLSILMRGRNYVFMDNVKNTVDNAVLEMAITAGYLEKRLLGGNEVVAVYSGMPFVITGNNPKMSTDIKNRVYLLDLSKPEDDKQYKHDKPEVYAYENGPKILRALFTLYYHWDKNAGRKLYTQRRIDGFIEWSTTIGGILQAAGISDFLDDTIKQIREVDPKHIQAADMAQQWYEAHGNLWLSTKQIFGFAAEAGYVKADDSPSRKTGIISNLLRSLRMVKLPGGYRFERNEDDHRNSSWRVVRDAGSDN